MVARYGLLLREGQSETQIPPLFIERHWRGMKYDGLLTIRLSQGISIGSDMVDTAGAEACRAAAVAVSSR